jgi:hypothetical protein
MTAQIVHTRTWPGGPLREMSNHKVSGAPLSPSHRPKTTLSQVDMSVMGARRPASAFIVKM